MRLFTLIALSSFLLAFSQKKLPQEKYLKHGYWIYQDHRNHKNMGKLPPNTLYLKNYKKFSDIRKLPNYNGFKFYRNGTYSDLRRCGTGYHIENHTWKLKSDTLFILYKQEVKKKYKIHGLNEKNLFMQKL